MRPSININFTVELQPGKYRDLVEPMEDVLRYLADRLTSDCNHTIANVTDSDWDLTIHPD